LHYPRHTRLPHPLLCQAHATEEESDAQTLAVHFKPALYLRNLSLNIPMASLAIKGRSAIGNIVTKHAVDRITRQKKDSSEG
jgi:topoisomerase IV subunit A